MSIDSTRFFQSRWDLWKQAKRFPSLPAKSNLELQFVLGRSNFGFEYGTYKQKYSGPKLDLSGCTVELKIVQMSYPPGPLDEARGEDWTTSSALCTIEGDITSPETDGEVVFVLDEADSDGKGNYLGQIRVTDSEGKYITPGYVRFNFLESLF